LTALQCDSIDQRIHRRGGITPVQAPRQRYYRGSAPARRILLASGSASLVSMVQSTNFRELDYRTFRRVLGPS